MHRCRECETVLQEGRNWHPSYAARTYRHCMECARAYSRRRYGLTKPGVKRRKPMGLGLAGSKQTTKRERSVKARVEATRARRERGGP